MSIRLIRSRIYFAVEGEGEQSFVKLLQRYSDDEGLFVHLDADVLEGGGYRKMLEKACRKRKVRNRSKAKSSILLVDEDRGNKDDDWSIKQLRKEANDKNFHLCVQSPNQEGLFFRMIKGYEDKKPNSYAVLRELKKVWPQYRKPIDFQEICKKFTFNDLLRVSNNDGDIDSLLNIIGLKKSKAVCGAGHQHISKIAMLTES